MKWLCSIVVCSLLFALPANAQKPLPRVFVEGADDTKGGEACSVAHASGVAAVESVLREEGVRPGNQQDYFDEQAIKATVELAVMAEPAPTCTTFITLTFGTSLMFVDFAPSLNLGHRLVDVVLCSRQGMTLHRKVDSQTAVNEYLQGMAKDCIATMKQ